MCSRLLCYLHRPTCHTLGPNEVFYASIIINCFLIYVVLRFIIDAIKNVVMSWRSESLNHEPCDASAFDQVNANTRSSDNALASPLILKEIGLKMYFGNLLFLLNYNRANLPTIVSSLVLWSLIFFPIFACIARVQVSNKHVILVNCTHGVDIFLL